MLCYRWCTHINKMRKKEKKKSCTPDISSSRAQQPHITIMRFRAQNKSISVHAVAGTHVVLLSVDVVDKAALEGLLGFAFFRKEEPGAGGSGSKKPSSGFWLKTMKRFQDSKGEEDSQAAMHDVTKLPAHAPIVQKFRWSGV